MVKDDSENEAENTTKEILKHVEEWKKDLATCHVEFEEAKDTERTALLEVDSIGNYVTATDHPWYYPTTIELERAPVVYGFNILVWDAIEVKYLSYLVHQNNRRYCILVKEFNQYDVL
jgi:hypothetical protein